MQTSSEQAGLPFIGIAEIAMIVIVILVLMAAARILFGGKKKTVIVQQPTSMPSQKIMVRCPSCETLNDENATFCSSCGIKLQAPSTPRARAKAYCKFCGAQMSGSSFCPKCGKSNL